MLEFDFDLSLTDDEEEPRTENPQPQQTTDEQPPAAKPQEKPPPEQPAKICPACFDDSAELYYCNRCNVGYCKKCIIAYNKINAKKLLICPECKLKLTAKNCVSLGEFDYIKTLIETKKNKFNLILNSAFRESISFHFSKSEINEIHKNEQLGKLFWVYMKILSRLDRQAFTIFDEIREMIDRPKYEINHILGKYALKYVFPFAYNEAYKSKKYTFKEDIKKEIISPFILVTESKPVTIKATFENAVFTYKEEPIDREDLTEEQFNRIYVKGTDAEEYLSANSYLTNHNLVFKENLPNSTRNNANKFIRYLCGFKALKYATKTKNDERRSAQSVSENTRSARSVSDEPPEDRQPFDIKNRFPCRIKLIFDYKKYCAEKFKLAKTTRYAEKFAKFLEICINHFKKIADFNNIRKKVTLEKMDKAARLIRGNLTAEEKNVLAYINQRIKLDFKFLQFDEKGTILDLLEERANLIMDNAPFLRELLDQLRPIIYKGKDPANFEKIDNIILNKHTEKSRKLLRLIPFNNYRAGEVFAKRKQTTKQQPQRLRCVCGGFLYDRKCTTCGRVLEKITNDKTEMDAATAAYIEKNCKECPFCGVNIYKSEGCSHMFCTNCKNGFDWNTLDIIEDRWQSNPLYFEWKRTLEKNRKRSDVFNDIHTTRQKLAHNALKYKEEMIKKFPLSDTAMRNKVRRYLITVIQLKFLNEIDLKIGEITRGEYVKQAEELRETMAKNMRLNRNEIKLLII